MATDLNSVALVGRIVRDCELKESGIAIANFSIAVNKKKKSKDGSWTDYTSFFECVYFGNGAKGVSPYLLKGQQVAITGSLEQQRWEKDGMKRNKIVITVIAVSLIGSKGGGESREEPVASAKVQSNKSTPPVEDDEDIPF